MYNNTAQHKNEVGAAWSAFSLLANEKGQGAEICPLSAIPNLSMQHRM